MILLVLPDVTQDEALLAQARSGDRSAIAAIYDQYFEPIYQFTRLRVNDVQMAEDITSSVFLAFIQALKKGKGPRNHLRGWLFRVARNHIADHYGARQPLPLETVEQWFADDATSPEFHTMRTLDIETIRALIGQLSADQQEVLLLRFDQQLSLQETADIMGRNINTIKTLQLRALKKLRTLSEKMA